MKSATSLMPPITGLSGTQFSILNLLGVIDPEGPEKVKQHSDEVGATFYGRHPAHNTLCCEYKKNVVD